MGIYVNPGNTAFQEAVNSMVYVDKSALISCTNRALNTKQKNMCISRPRRFGKSMAADMLCAYYSAGCDSRALFSGLAIASDQTFEVHLNRHSVIRLDMQRFLETTQDLETFISQVQCCVIAELAQVFPQCVPFPANNRLKTVLDDIFRQTGSRFVFIIDEWDHVFRVARESTEKQKEYLDFLRGLFKGADYVEFAYMTGILPIKKYGEHSAINMFDEYSMIDPKNLGTYFGFTTEEVLAGCQRYGANPQEIKQWYDGYLLNGISIYNPKSVADAWMWKRCKSYWTGTETYEALKIYMDLNFDGLKETIIEMLGNGRVSVDPTTFQNDMTTLKTRDDVLTLLVHLGYLAFDEVRDEVFIPNQEIAQEFLRSIKTGGWDGVISALKRSEELLKSTWALDGDTVAEGIAAIHNETASLLQYNNENSLSCTLLMAYYSAKAYYKAPLRELPAGKGFADIVYLPKQDVKRPALVVELKWNRSAISAINQIKERQYASWLQDYAGDVLLIGINYDSKKKVHSCVIEKVEKEM